MTEPLARGRSDRAGCDSNEADSAEPRRLTYEDGYREGLAAGRSARSAAADRALRNAREVNEPPSRVAFLLEAIALGLLDRER